MSQEGRQYHVLEALGKGGFGTVYRAELKGAGGFAKQVALKILNPDMEGSDEIAMRLRDEARVLGLLRHRAIVQVDSLVKLNSRWTVVMEYVEGVDLRRLIKAGKVPVGCALEIVEEVASALHVAYAKPSRDGEALCLMHRDIKPANIQLTPAGEVKVLDFGVAKADFGSREAETRNLVFGSMGYMSPERLDFIDSHEGDIYALGVVLYELITAKTFGKTSASEKRHAAQMAKLAATIREICDDDALIEFMQATLAYEPDDRPAAKDFKRLAVKIRKKHSEPELADWVEGVIPPLLADRPPIEDDLSGSILVEQVTGESSTLIGEMDPDTDFSVGVDRISLHDTGEHGLYTEEAPANKLAWGVGLLAAVLALGAVILGGMGVGIVVGLLGGDGDGAEVVEVAADPVADPVADVTPDGGSADAPPTEDAVADAPAEPDPPPVEAKPDPVPPKPDPVVAKPDPVVAKPPVKVDKPPPPKVGGDPRLSISGAQSAVLISGGKRYSIPGTVPPGTYSVEANFSGTVRTLGEVTVTAGDSSLNCNAMFGKCNAK